MAIPPNPSEKMELGSIAGVIVSPAGLTINTFTTWPSREETKADFGSSLSLPFAM
ncbi:MAG: hypothetical protein ACREAC_13550 [Blastocatellia bacterium]